MLMKHFIVYLLLSVFLAARGFAADDADAALTSAVRAAVDKVAPSVLRIETFGGLEKVGKVLIGSGPTTGLAVGEDGYLVASAYSFAQQPTSILVTMPSGKRVAAQIVARDLSRMLVLLKVASDEKLAVPTAVGRHEMTVGQTAIAVGRTYDKNAPNVSVGIVSATNRIWGKAIQTDAKISPANYGGPLVDLHGRVLGVLVPMSPQGEGDLAGAEWYDSGIGFAVPLTDVLERLDTMKAGEDLQPGKLGVSLAGKGDYAEPVEIAAVLPGSPAAKAGLQKDDQVVEVAGQKVRWLAHMKHALGAKYAGDTVSIVVLRDDKRIEAEAELAGEIAAYDIPFLGILPMRDFDGQGVKVRYVFAGSAAGEAGVKVGDVVMAFGKTTVENAAGLRDLVGTHDRKESPRVELKVERGGKAITMQVALASLPTDVPAELPPARSGEPMLLGQKPATGMIDVKFPEERNVCQAFVPPNYRPKVPHGLVVRLHAPDKADRSGFPDQWKTLCEKYNLILLAPKSAKEDQWEPTEAEFVRKAMDEAMQRWNIDPQRIIVHGHKAGGTLAALVAFTNEDIVRAVSLVDAPLPRRAAIPAADPVQRMAYHVAVAEKSDLAEPIKAAIERLQEMKLPVTVKKIGDQWRYLTDEELAELARWIDTLDRI